MIFIQKKKEAVKCAAPKIVLPLVADWFGYTVASASDPGILLYWNVTRWVRRLKNRT
jgi:hypothetical protein